MRSLYYSNENNMLNNSQIVLAAALEDRLAEEICPANGRLNIYEESNKQIR